MEPETGVISLQFRSCNFSVSCEFMSVLTLEPGCYRVCEDNVDILMAICGKQRAPDDLLALYAFLDASQMGAEREQAAARISQVCDQPRVLRHIPDLFKSDFDVNPLVPAISSRIYSLLLDPIFATFPAPLLELILKHADLDSVKAVDVVRYLASRFKEDPEAFAPLLAGAVRRHFSLVTLSIVMNLPDFDLRLLRDEISLVLVRSLPQRDAVVCELCVEADGSVFGCLNYLSDAARLLISASSYQASPFNLLNFASSGVYQSAMRGPQYITTTYVGSEVCPTGYALMAAEDIESAPMSWQLLASVDGVKWIIIHEVCNGSLEAKVVEAWATPGVLHSFRHFRLMLFPKPGAKMITLAGFEIFGTVSKFDAVM